MGKGDRAGDGVTAGQFSVPVIFRVQKTFTILRSRTKRPPLTLKASWTKVLLGWIKTSNFAQWSSRVFLGLVHY